MAVAPLSQLNDWELEDKGQDLRGHRLVDANGQTVGIIDQMLVDTDAEQVIAIRLENGTEYSVRDFEIRDGMAVLRTGAAVWDRAAWEREHVAGERVATTGRGRMATDRVATGRAAGEVTETERESIPLMEERLRVRKRQVQLGEVEITPHVVEEQRTVEVPVTREEVYVERVDVEPRPADREMAPEGQTIRVPVMGEEVEATKEAVVTGEVVVGKRAVQETREVSDTVRRTDVEVEREGNVEVHGADAAARRDVDADKTRRRNTDRR